jgi:serine/threonine-protein kinase
MAGLYADAFAADPKLADDLEGDYRYRAARAAAVAGRGGGADGAALSEAERTHWREQARQWLRLDLGARIKQLQSAAPADRARLLKSLTAWRTDPDLAGLREPAALDQLPTGERQECRALWSDVDAQLTAPPSSR